MPCGAMMYTEDDEGDTEFPSSGAEDVAAVAADADSVVVDDEDDDSSSRCVTIMLAVNC